MYLLSKNFAADNDNPVLKFCCCWIFILLFHYFIPSPINYHYYHNYYI